ncbi:MAG: pyridoxal kinase PdxY [Proteobacteria bacterium]|nr:pyridoxal kinase PdxY [Pseudomonadota bacterium]
MNILSIQSHVTYGHVGNSAAVFPLQRLGFEVWPLHTVQFSNHAGYDGFTGRAFPAEHLREVVEGLAARGVLGACDGVLSGYLGGAEAGAAVLEAVDRVKAANPRALYACDPVMGDGAGDAGGGLYVDPALPAFFREHALARADIVTPNLFELETLTGATVATLDEAVAAARRALALGPSVVLVTGLRHEATGAGEVELLAVTGEDAWRLCTPLLACDPQPNGAGDLLAALYLGHYLRTREPARALEAAAAATFAVLARTQAAGTRELQLIAAQDEIVAPKRHFPAEKIV